MPDNKAQEKHRAQLRVAAANTLCGIIGRRATVVQFDTAVTAMIAFAEAYAEKQANDIPKTFVEDVV